MGAQDQGWPWLVLCLKMRIVERENPTSSPAHLFRIMFTAEKLSGCQCVVLAPIRERSLRKLASLSSPFQRLANQHTIWIFPFS